MRGKDSKPLSRLFMGQIERWQMPSRVSPNEFGHNWLTDRESFRKLPLGERASRVQPAKLYRIGIRYNGFRVFFSKWSVQPALLLRILHVFLMSACKQVQRIAAFPVVAMMADKEFFWNISKNQFVRKPVGSLAVSIYPKRTISPFTTYRANPWPTFIKLADFNLCPEKGLSHFIEVGISCLKRGSCIVRHGVYRWSLCWNSQLKNA